MPTDIILKTKLFIPPLRDGMVSRPRLVRLINEGIKKRVLFVSAPAGFGKSTLMTEWAAQSNIPVAWVSLDKTENDPVSFLSYLISSVQSIYQNLGDAVLSAVIAPGSPPVENLLNAWINEIAEHSDNFALILDDFHNIQNHSVIKIFGSLVDHQPAQMHLLLASRAGLPISYSRTRARGELIDLGIADLRFTTEETIEYFKSQLNSKISDEDAKTLGERTEGWIAGLQMAVLSLRSSKDISQYVAQFSAQNRYITDYLLDEVLQHQPDEIQRFLLSTSILERFTASLCNHVVGNQNSQEVIETLETSGLFTIPLDSTRTWYRYHHLFSELLQKRLDESPLLQRESLHRRAFEWFSAREMLEECIEHAFAVYDYDLVIEQIEKSLNQIMAQGQFRNYLAWVNKIPRQYLQEKPRLEIIKIFMLHELGQLEQRDKHLNFVEQILGPAPDDLEGISSGMVINHGVLAAIKAIIYASGYFRVDEATKYVELAVRLLPPHYELWRAMALGALPFLDRALGNYEIAIERYTQLVELDLQAGFIFQSFIAYSALTRTYLETGKLKRAIITCQKALDLDSKYGANLSFARLAYLIMGELMYQAGELKSAEAYVEMGLEHVIRHGDIYSILDGYFTLARIQLARGDEDQALALMREMHTTIGELTPSKNAIKVMESLEAYVTLYTEQWENVKKWARGPGYAQLDGRYLFGLESHSYVGIYRVSQNPIKIYSDLIKITLARLYLRMRRYEAGLEIIDDTLLDVAQGGRIKHQIELMLLKSIALNKLNRKTEAIQECRAAIHIAASDGFVQVFRNEGVEIISQLKEIKETGFQDIEEQVFFLQLYEKIRLSVDSPNINAGFDLDHLSAREIEVLRNLASGKSYSQVAELLSISRNTLKTHTKRIYQKLGVNGLLQALNKARELKLME